MVSPLLNQTLADLYIVYISTESQDVFVSHINILHAVHQLSRHSCNPIALFDAPVVFSVKEESKDIKVRHYKSFFFPSFLSSSHSSYFLLFSLFLPKALFLSFILLSSSLLPFLYCVCVCGGGGCWGLEKLDPLRPASNAFGDSNRQRSGRRKHWV